MEDKPDNLYVTVLNPINAVLLSHTTVEQLESLLSEAANHPDEPFDDVCEIIQLYIQLRKALEVRPSA